MSRDGGDAPAYDEDEFDSEDESDSLDSQKGETAAPARVSKPFSSGPPNLTIDIDNGTPSDGGAGGLAAAPIPKDSVEEAISKVLEGGMWKEMKDPTSGKKYYYHVVTRKTTWDLADELGLKPKPTTTKATGGGDGEPRSARSLLGDSSTSLDGYGDSKNSSYTQVPQLSLPTNLTFGAGKKPSVLTGPAALSVGGGSNTGDTPRTQDDSAEEPSVFAPWAAGGSETASTPREDGGGTSSSNHSPAGAGTTTGKQQQNSPEYAVPTSLPTRSKPLEPSSMPAAATPTEQPKVGLIEIVGGAGGQGGGAGGKSAEETKQPDAQVDTKPVPKKGPATTLSDDTDSDFSTASQMIKNVQDEQKKTLSLDLAKARAEVDKETTGGDLDTFKAFGGGESSESPNLVTEDPPITSAASTARPGGVTSAPSVVRPVAGSSAMVATSSSLAAMPSLAMKQGQGPLGPLGAGGGSLLQGGVIPGTMSAPSGVSPMSISPATNHLPGSTTVQNSSAASFPAATQAIQHQQSFTSQPGAAPPAAVVQYVDPNQVALNQLTAGAEALGHLVRAYKELKQPPSQQYVTSTGEYSSAQAQQGVGRTNAPKPAGLGATTEHYTVQDGDLGPRRDGGGLGVNSYDQQQRMKTVRGEARSTGAPSMKTRRQEALYKLQEKETMLEEDMLDMVMHMLLDKQGGPLPSNATKKSGGKKKVNVKFTKTGAASGRRSAAAIEEEEVLALRDQWRSYQNPKHHLGGSVTNTATSHVGIGAFEELTETFSEAGSLQRLLEENCDKYIVSAVKKKRIHSSVARFVVLDCLAALTDVMNYTAQQKEASLRTRLGKKSVGAMSNKLSASFDGRSPVVDPNFMVFMCVDGTKCTQRVVDFATRLLHCLPTEPVSNLSEGNVGGSSSSGKKPKILYRLEHWVNQHHWLEIHRALLRVLREIESVVFDLDSVVAGLHSGPPHSQRITDIDEADLTSCLGSVISLFCPAVKTGLKNAEDKGDSEKNLGEGKENTDTTTGATKSTRGSLPYTNEKEVETAEQLLFASRKLVSDFIQQEDIKSVQGVQVAEDVVLETVFELLDEPSIQDAVMRRALGKFRTKQIPSTLREKTEVQNQKSVQQEVEQQVQRVLDRIRYEVEQGVGDTTTEF